MHKKSKVFLVTAMVAFTGLTGLVWSERRGKTKPQWRVSVKVISEPPEIPVSPYMKEFGRSVENQLNTWTDSHDALPCLELVFVSLQEGRQKVILMTVWDCKAQAAAMTIIQTSQEPQGAARLALTKLLEFLKRRGGRLRLPQNPKDRRACLSPCGLFFQQKNALNTCGAVKSLKLILSFIH